MTEPEAAIGKVEDRLVAVLRAFPQLSDHTILTSDDEASEKAVDANTILVFTTAYQMDQSDEQGQTRHRATLEVERVGKRSAAGTISRTNQRAMAWVVAALAADRTLGGLIEDIQEVDVAPVAQNARDHGAASLQCSLTFYTPRDDWFTIVGIGGATF